MDTLDSIANRLLIPYLLDAVRMLEAGIASRENIDTAINLGLNYPMWPLALIDLIGVDTILFSANAIYEELKEPWFAAPLLIKKMVTAGWLGCKTGKGFMTIADISLIVILCIPFPIRKKLRWYD